MKCPVCGKGTITKLYYSARCTTYVHTACWQNHAATHRKK